MFDAMTISQSLTYSSSSDAIIGFVDDGFQKSCSLANQLLVLMIGGLSKKWKQIIGYFLVKQNMDVAGLRFMVMEGIRQCANAGLTVKAIVADQEPKHQALFRDLGDGGFSFVHPVTQLPVALYFDPPHLLKSARNCLYKHNIEVSSYIPIFSIY